MTAINAYLSFNGNCKEAMTFYQKCLGGVLSFQTIGDSPLANKLPKKMLSNVLHATLSKEQWVIMGTDISPEPGLVVGNAVSLVINCSTEQEIRQYYSKLVQGGKSTHFLAPTFWNALFGTLIDKYGHQWLLNLNRN